MISRAKADDQCYLVMKMNEAVSKVSFGAQWTPRTHYEHKDLA
jgi:hypothetical protein